MAPHRASSSAEAFSIHGPSAAFRRSRHRHPTSAPGCGDSSFRCTGSRVWGGGIYVAARVHAESAVERGLATLRTGTEVRFRAAIPRGPSRELRVAYWPNDVAPTERYFELRVHARPRLTTRPHHAIR